MGIDRFRRNMVPDRQLLQLAADAAGGHRHAPSVCKEKTGVYAFGMKPAGSLVSQSVRKIDTPYFPAFRIKIHISQIQMLRLDLGKLADAGACGGHIADDEVVQAVSVPEQAAPGFFCLPEGLQMAFSRFL